MDKIKLSIDSLQVNSFIISGDEPASGTVNAHALVTPIPNCGGCNTRNTCSTNYC